MYTLHIKKGFPYFPVTCIAINVDPKHHAEKLHKFVNKSENAITSIQVAAKCLPNVYIV